MKSFAHSRGSSDGLVYFALAHTKDPPDDAAWKSYLDAIAAAAGSVQQSIPLIVVTDGGAPNAMQRRAWAAAVERARVPPFAHIFSDDTFVRGVVTAFHWLSRNPVVAHSPRDFVEVCAGAKIPPEQALYDLITLQKSLPTIQTLRLLVDSVYPARAHL